MGTLEADRRQLRELNARAAECCTDGRYAAAVALFERVVAGCTVALGVDDPDTLISHGNLVVTQLRLDPRGPALRGLDANLEARRRVLGVGHPATRTADQARGAAYRLAAAELERMLAETVASLGSEHPDAAALRTELAELRGAGPEPVGPGAEPGSGGPAASAGPPLPAPRRPRGARFPHAVPDQRAPEPARDAPGPARVRRPLGARFRRGS